MKVVQSIGLVFAVAGSKKNKQSEGHDSESDARGELMELMKLLITNLCRQPKYICNVSL